MLEPAIYFAKEKDRFAVMYGDGNIGKAGFSTQGGSRATILTRLEEVIRNRQINIYSSRLYEELKTFIWKGTKPQAMRGKNDDLVMALAIGCWLFEASDKYCKQTVDLNTAMLKAMGINKTNAQGILDPRLKSMQNSNPFKPVILTGENQPPDDDVNQPANPLTDFYWLLK